MELLPTSTILLFDPATTTNSSEKKKNPAGRRSEDGFWKLDKKGKQLRSWTSYYYSIVEITILFQEVLRAHIICFLQHNPVPRKFTNQSDSLTRTFSARMMSTQRFHKVFEYFIVWYNRLFVRMWKWYFNNNIAIVCSKWQYRVLHCGFSMQFSVLAWRRTVGVRLNNSVSRKIWPDTERQVADCSPGEEHVLS